MLRDDPEGSRIFDPKLSISDKEKLVVEAWKALVEDFAKLKKPWGAKDNPAKTCRDLALAYPELDSGEYWIDPNEGHYSDALLVFCNIPDKQTCIYSSPVEIEKKNWYQGKPGYRWFSEDVADGHQFTYKTDPGQLFLLQTLSRQAYQNITYHCKKSVAYYDSANSDYTQALKLMSFNDVELVAGGYPKFTYEVSYDGCRHRRERWDKTVIEYRTKKPQRLPVLDIAPSDIGGSDQEFGVTIGPVCFS